MEKESIGLVIGKFMPLHNGHLELFKFAFKQCTHLEVALVCKDQDIISCDLRHQWIEETLGNILLEFSADIPKSFKIHKIDEPLPRTQGHTTEAFQVWTDYFAQRFMTIDVIVSSEEYADQLANRMGKKHVYFDKERKLVSISASEILCNPEAYLDLVPKQVQEYLLNKNEARCD